jgi:hypothetical protein
MGWKRGILGIWRRADFEVENFVEHRKSGSDREGCGHAEPGELRKWPCLVLSLGQIWTPTHGCLEFGK